MTTSEIDRFIGTGDKGLLLDVRSPSEYVHAHIPGAINLPLFDDAQRARVGTVYKQQGKREAIQVGLDYFGPRMREMVKSVEKQNKSDDELFIYCWRGGMRSEAVQWLMELYGFRTRRLAGGYKNFRNWALGSLDKKWPFSVLAGYTGAGKTRILHELERLGEAVIDLEGLACHRGSTFGHIGMEVQPSTEMFENFLAVKLHELSLRYPGKTIWIEDESIRLGHVNLPHNLFAHMQHCPLCMLELDFDSRLENILEDYGDKDPEKLKEAILRIQKRLGPNETKECLSLLGQNNVPAAFRILLSYYDRWYDRALQKKEKDPDRIYRFEINRSARECAEQLIKLYL